jgi:hypothetical protein
MSLLWFPWIGFADVAGAVVVLGHFDAPTPSVETADFDPPTPAT